MPRSWTKGHGMITDLIVLCWMWLIGMGSVVAIMALTIYEFSRYVLMMPLWAGAASLVTTLILANHGYGVIRTVGASIGVWAAVVALLVGVYAFVDAMKGRRTVYRRPGGLP